MNVYLANLALFTVYALIIRSRGEYLFKYKTSHGAALFCSLAALHWIVISGLRHESIGSDTIGYRIDSYAVTVNESWSSLIQKFIDIYAGNLLGKDPGYSLFEKFTQVFFYDYQLYLVLIAVIFTVPMARWICKYSADVYLSFLVYSVLFFAFFAITGLRQTIVTAMAVFIGYRLILNRQLFLFIVVLLIASTIHKSALIFLPFYFICRFSVKRLHICILFLVLPILFVNRNSYSDFFKKLMGYEEYGINEAASTLNFTIMMVLIGLMVLWRLPTMIKRNWQAAHFINAYLMSMLLVPLTFVNPSAMRAVQYYSIFIILLIPEIIKSFKGKDARIVYLAAVGLLFTLFIGAGSGGKYAFFWSI